MPAVDVAAIGNSSRDGIESSLAVIADLREVLDQTVKGRTGIGKEMGVQDEVVLKADDVLVAKMILEKLAIIGRRRGFSGSFPDET
jgi:hypothetical protein